MKKYYRRLKILILISLLAIFVAACGSKGDGSSSLNDTSKGNIATSQYKGEATGNKVTEEIKSNATGVLADILNDGKVVVGTEAVFQPFEFMKDGKIVGYGKDILDYIIEDLGVELQQENIPWQGILPGLDTGRFDFVATTVGITPARVKKYDFTIPIADGTLAILKRKDDDSIQTPEDIIGKVVGTQLSSSQLNGLELFNEALKSEHGEGVKEIKEYIGFPEAYQELATGRIDGVAQSRSNLSGILKEQPDAFEMTETFGEPLWFSWVTRQDEESQDLLAYLNAIILELQDSGKLAEMQEKWFGFTMDTPTSDFLPEE